ncbi:hypothetical protein SPRG_21164 [Saprolegnia parasitica CBS 223.65]|uniref:Uncharacterized protein n=1 Tax=Saprolegnia parasitica (strain CBS 223.65) TaxID=695850 RepID=A0A067BWG2_SAPPC|nr:hypothetical protein SPRG_21164 [Saprolegnia parasitica CBS 223.65]KDO22613.1 hypothetical protein SPRG_21164 [Saprolegnia parasitica CBS 223.65]|eukprot:XP_012206730.1 hypothetical protein SPRG_21164 [Saprolegnia parasitica CBS 223.65]
MLLETIRSYPEWLAVLAATDSDALPSPPTSSRMDPDMLNDYCMVLVDDAASVSARIDMVRAIASSKDKVGADHLLTALASPRTPMPVQDAIVHAVLAELPSHVSVVATRLRLRIVQTVLLYAARHVRHGWMHVLEALFYLPSPSHQLQVLLAIVQESVVMPYNAWENLSQVASIATVWTRRLLLPNDQLQPLGKATMQLWALVAPHLNQVPWRDAAALLHLETPETPGEALVHRLFAPLAIAQALAIEAVFTYATRQVDGVDVSVLQRTTDVILHPPLPDDDDKTTLESLRRARSLSIDMAWSARLQWRLLRGLVEWLETAPSPPLLKWLHTLARDPGYIATTPLLERLQSVELPMPCDLASAMTALDTSVDTNQHVTAFNALWDTHVASSSVFNAVLLVQDADVRASLQQGHLDDVAAVYETLWSDDDAVLLYPIADVLDRLRADVTATTEAFLQSSFCGARRMACACVCA